MALSAAIATAGSWMWQRRPASRDILFGDLMLLGFVRRLRAERRLGEVARLLGKIRSRPTASGQSGSAPDPRAARALAGGPRPLHARPFAARGPERRDGGGADGPTPRDRSRRCRWRRRCTTPARSTPPPDPEQAGRALRRGVRGHEAAPRRRRGHARAAGRPRDHWRWCAITTSGSTGAAIDGLAGEEIPLGARIIAVADTFESAITSVRPYRPPRKQQAALKILKEDAGGRLDTQVVTTFLSCYSGRRTAAWSSLAVAAPAAGSRASHRRAPGHSRRARRPRSPWGPAWAGPS